MSSAGGAVSSHKEGAILEQWGLSFFSYPSEGLPFQRRIWDSSSFLWHAERPKGQASKKIILISEDTVNNPLG